MIIDYDHTMIHCTDSMYCDFVLCRLCLTRGVVCGVKTDTLGY